MFIEKLKDALAIEYPSISAYLKHVHHNQRVTIYLSLATHNHVVENCN